MGIIPIGSLVMLESDELAVVMKTPTDKANAERPVVKIIADAQGTLKEDGADLDLSLQDETGAYPNSILRLVDNTEYKFDTSRYFV